MSKRERTSTPCVGSSARMTWTSRRNGRVSETFCWLPPERKRTGCSTDGVLTFSRSTRRFTAAPSRRPREHHRVQVLDLARPERGRRLVEQEDLRVEQERLHHLDELPLRERQ